MHLFQWMGPADLPKACDLRRLGWRLEGRGVVPGRVRCPVLCDRRLLAAPDWLGLLGYPACDRRMTLLLGIDDSEERGRLLALGFGDLCGAATAIEEVEARTMRIAERLELGRQVIRLGPLRLELVLRDGWVAGRRLGLHPREFGLLWRLAECPGEDVSHDALVSDVWRLAARPEINSLAVHLSRLRAKLRIAGLDGMLASTAAGYRLDLTGFGNLGVDLASPMVEEPTIASRDREACATN